MKRLFYLICVIPQLLLANNGFEQGNALYRKGMYQQALEAYQSVLNSGKESADLYFNMGNCYYKLNKVAPAIYNYEKALVLSPGDEEIQNNLVFAHKMTIDEIKVVPKVGFAKIIRDFTSAFHYNTWAWITVALSLLFLLFFVGYYFSQYALSKRIFFIGMFVLVFLILLSFLAAITERSHFVSEQPAIVFAEMVTVKSEPRSASADAFVLHEGAKVFLHDAVDQWVRIELTDGSEGWIDRTAVKAVK